MDNINTYKTKISNKYNTINQLNYENNYIYSSSSSHKNKIRLKLFPSSKIKNSNLKINCSDYSPFNKNNSTLNFYQVNNTISNINHNNIKTYFSHYNKHDTKTKNQNNKYSNNSNMPKKSNCLNIIPIIPNSKIKKNISKQFLGEKKINSKIIKIINCNKINSSKLNNSFQRHNHSFFEVKSLTKDFISPQKNNLTINIKNNNSNMNYIYTEKEEALNKNTNDSTNNNSKRYSNNIFNINCNINNNINLIINSKNVKYIPKKNEIVFNKNKIYKKNINATKIIKYNNKRIELSSTKINKYKLNKINSYYFSYIPKLKEKNEKFVENKSHKSKKNKKMKKENKLILKNLNCKTFEEDFPIKIKYNRNYRINKKLKPQISLRLTLFKISTPEIERFFIVNFFYSENLRIPEEKNKLEFFFK